MQLRAYRNEKMNQIRALIIMRRKIATATTQITINVTFERRKELVLGKISENRREREKDVEHQMKKVFVGYCLHRLYID